MFGLSKKKKKIPPLTVAMNAAIAAVSDCIKLQVNAALGKEGMDFCPDLGAADNLAVALYGYAFLDGMVQHNGAVEAWSGGKESLARIMHRTDGSGWPFGGFE